MKYDRTGELLDINTPTIVLLALRKFNDNQYKDTVLLYISRLQQENNNLRQYLYNTKVTASLNNKTKINDWVLVSIIYAILMIVAFIIMFH